MATKTGWSFIGLFIIALVLSLPFYSAQALAVSVQISKNQGQAAIPKFIDAQGDVWTVEAVVTGAPQAVTPQDVKIKIGENEAPFTSCSDGPLGVTCEYIVPLTDGIVEKEYPFQVIYRFLNALGFPDSVSNGDIVKADGSGPSLDVQSVQQSTSGKVKLDFTVNDKKPSLPSVGIKSIEIVDGDTGTVLQTINLPAPGVLEWDYQEDGTFNGFLQATLEGEGLKLLRFRATDWLNHKSEQDPLVQFNADFVPPAIKDNLKFPELGEFIGEVDVTSSVTLDIVETDLEEVKASSEIAALENTPATECQEDAEEEKLWHCRWEGVEITPSESLAVTVTAKDGAGNTAQKTLSRQLVKDSSAPQIEYFGTERGFEGKQFLRGHGRQRIILQVEEQGAGMSIDGVRANLLALGKGTLEPPTACEQTESSFDCYWEIEQQFTSSGTVNINLVTFEDKVGNQGELPQLELFIDTEGPKVDKVELFGLSEIGEKDYFQSNDRLKVKVKGSELSSGIVVLVNVNDLVMDAESTFPEDFYTREFTDTEGWQVFPESCQRHTEESAEGEEEWNGEWTCELETESIKSGPDDVEVEIKIQDSAGNEAQQLPETAKNVDWQARSDKGVARFSILALSEEANPDYWEVSPGYPRQKLDFVDLDVVDLTYTRMPFEVRLKSDNPQAEILVMDVEGCDPGEEAAPELGRTLFYGGSNAKTGTLVLEFNPFNGREFFTIKAGGPFVSEQGKFEEATALYTCHLRVYSQIGETALRSAEVQDVPLEVTFAFSRLGAIDESLANKVKELKGSGWMKFYDVVGTLNTIIQWLNYAANLLQTLSSILTFFGLFSDALQIEATGVEKGPFGYLGPALRGACVKVDISTSSSWKYIETLQIPLQILNCAPKVFTQEKKGQETPAKQIGVSGEALTWYAVWQRNALETYNLVSLRTPLGIPANNVYENMYASLIGACVPGLVYNINKAREIYCRKIVCYGREVPAGFATTEACDRLYSLQMCEWVLGPAFDFALLGGIASWGNLLRSFFTSPLGLISLVDVFACASMCWKPGGMPAVLPCKLATGLNKLLDMINSIYTSVKQRPDVTVSPYCGLAEDINLEELAGGEVAAPEDGEEPQPVTGS